MSLFLQTLAHQKTPTCPIWMMRQAGRYLPEYQTLRAKAGSFLNLVYNSDQAAEVTIQPIRRFGFDAAILFSDILIVPHAMGQALTFEAGEGPRLDPVTTTIQLDQLAANDPSKIWAPVIETVKLVRAGLAREGFSQTALIGFAGAPWTVACYMVQGMGKDHTFSGVVAQAQNDPVFFDRLIGQLTTTTINYLSAQIDAGAQAIQLFDSWSGIAPGDVFDRYVIQPTAQIVTTLQAKYPHIPVIGFPRGAGVRLVDYIQATGIQAVQCDQDVDLKILRTQLAPRITTQGNLAPEILIRGGNDLDKAIDAIIDATMGAPHIFNLGHGILPETPIAHVEQLVKRVRGLS